MTMRRAAVAVAVVFALACGSARKVPPIGSPLQLATQKLEMGRHEFIEYCHQCHPHGESGLAPAINDKPLPGFLIRFQVRHGLGAMPAFSEEVISDEELDAVLEA